MPVNAPYGFDSTRWVSGVWRGRHTHADVAYVYAVMSGEYKHVTPSPRMTGAPWIPIRAAYRRILEQRVEALPSRDLPKRGVSELQDSVLDAIEDPDNATWFRLWEGESHATAMAQIDAVSLEEWEAYADRLSEWSATRDRVTHEAWKCQRKRSAVQIMAEDRRLDLMAERDMDPALELRDAAKWPEPYCFFPYSVRLARKREAVAVVPGWEQQQNETLQEQIWRKSAGWAPTQRPTKGQEGK